jgi:hypothetical protein
MSDATSMPSGTPLALLVEGILDGRARDTAALHRASSALSQCGAGTFRCEISGGRFTVMPQETHVAAGGFDEAAQTRFLDALREVVAAAAPRSVESNLRCRMIFAADVAETLFVVQNDEVEPMTRVRPRTPADDAMVAPTMADLPLGLRRREVLVLAPMLLLLGLLVAWWTGWVDRVLAARAESLTLVNGPFGALLDVRAGRQWGNYRIEVRRGAEYPATPQALAERRDHSESLTARAACELVGNGGELFVQSLDGDGKVLDQARIELRPLLGTADAVVETKLPGRMQAATLQLSLSTAPKPQ